MPRTKKPRSQTVDKRNGRPMEVVGAQLERFDPPGDLCAEALDEWAAYWSDPVSGAPTLADRDLLVRWVTNLSRYWVTVREADADPVQSGLRSPVENPLYRVADRALVVAERCERQLGVGARNRADLGLAIVAEKRSLADMNARFEEISGADDDQEAEDPRLAVVRGEVV